jgi:hypothetical protein
MRPASETELRSAALTHAFDPSDQLDAARVLLAKQGAKLQLPPMVAALQAAGFRAVVPAAPSRESADFVSAARQDLPFDSPVELGLPVATPPAIRPGSVEGPFRGATGFFWMRFYGPVHGYSISPAGAPRPTFFLTRGRLPVFAARARRRRGSPPPRRGSPPYVIELDGGTVWILASALGAGVPATSYVGLTIKGGTLTFPHPLTVAGDQLTYTGGLVATLDADLAPGTSSGDHCPAQPTVSGPDHIRITWKPGSITVSPGPGSAKFSGNQFDLTAYVGPPRVDTDLNILFFPYTISPTSLDASTLSTDAATFSGTTGLDGGWGLSLVQPLGQFGEALGPGLFVFYCRDLLHGTWPGAPGPVDMADARLIVRQGQLLLTTRHGTVDHGFSQRILLWCLRPETGSPRLPLNVLFGGQIAFTYFCDSLAGYGFYATCGVNVTLDRPVNVAGRPLVFPGASQGLFGLQHGPSGLICRVAVLAKSFANRTEIIALRNALLAVTEPAFLFLEGALSGKAIDQGTLTIVLGSLGWLPTLPDPYVSNRSRTQGREAERANPTLISATASWSTPQNCALGFQGALGGPLGVNAAGTNDPTRPVQQGMNQIRVPTQTAEGSLIASQDSQLRPRVVDKQLGNQAELLSAFDGRAAKALGQEGARAGVRLLDVSTKKDLLGVELTGQARAAGPLFQLRALDVCTPASALHVFALPQVQWEPVRTLDRDQDIPHLGFFPTPLASVTDGGATRLAVQSVKLVAAIPDIATDVMLQEFTAGQSAALLTTLPFGLRALVELRPRATGGRSADTVMRNEPTFVQPDLQGGAQVAFIAESGPSGRDDSSYFDGSAIQLRNGVALDTGVSLNISVLGSVVDPADSVQELFNNEFGPGAATAKVPVTRLDVSGYGGSCFSDWMKRSAAYAEAAKVQFEVIVGRTALEIVKFATVLYPWGIRLTRTVTIERRGGGGVIRRDSGWQASSPGLFQFPPSAVPGTNYTVHPGLFRGLFEVKNIRSTGLAPISFMGRNGKTVTLAAKFFDARVRIDGLEGGSDLPANGVLGFLQIAPIGEPLHEDDLVALLDQQGPTGGPIDGVVQVGGSGFRVRATRIEVGYAPGATGRPEFIGTIRSAPVFRQDGAWSAVRMPGPSNANPDSEAVSANEVKGLPIVREGQLLGVTGDAMNLGPQTDYRFADPADIHRPNDPVWEYGLLQTSPAHVFVYPRPHVDPGVREIRTRSAPRFADYYARCTSKGLFPPAANSINLPANTLVVDPATGGFQLRDSVNIGAPRPPLIVAQRGSDVMQVNYSGATLSFSFSQTNWSMEMPGIEMWTDCLGVTKVAGLRSHLVAGTTARPIVRDIAMLLKQEIEAALTFLTGFSSRPEMGSMDLGASNTVTEHKFTLIKDKDWEFPNAPGGSFIYVKLSAGGKAEFGWKTDSAPPPGTTPGTTYDIGLLATASVEGKIPVYTVGVAAVYILLGAEIEIGGAVELAPMVPAELKFEFDLKAFIGVGIAAAAGVFDGSVAIGYHLAIDGGTVKNGIFGRLEAEVHLVVVTVSVEGEVGGLWYDDASHPPSAHAADLDGEVEVNVELLFISLHGSYEYTETKFFN